MGDGGLLALSWNNHQTTFCQVLSKLREKHLYSDVTLACEGKFYLAHKLVLSTCSEYFENMLEHTPCKHPVIVLKDIGSAEVERLLSYMYAGVVKVAQNDLGQLIKAAELLKIKGLAVPDEPPQQQTRKASRTPRDEPSSPRPKRRRINNSTGEQKRANTSTAATPLSPGRPSTTSTPVSLSTTASLKHSPPDSHTSAEEIEVESTWPELDQSDGDIKLPLSLPTDYLNRSSTTQEVLDETLVVKEEVCEEPLLDEGLLVASGSSCNPLLVPNSQLENLSHDVTPAPQDCLGQTQHSPGPSNTQPYSELLSRLGFSQPQLQPHHAPESVLPRPSALQMWVGGGGGDDASAAAGDGTARSSGGGDDCATAAGDCTAGSSGGGDADGGGGEMSGAALLPGMDGYNSGDIVAWDQQPQQEGMETEGQPSLGGRGNRKGGYTCPFCWRGTFKTSRDFKRHLRTHTGEKPYACTQCSYRSTRKDKLRNHRLAIHKEDT